MEINESLRGLRVEGDIYLILFILFVFSSFFALYRLRAQLTRPGSFNGFYMLNLKKLRVAKCPIAFI